MSGIEVKRPEDVTSREDFISCAPFSCKLKAAACVGRRTLVIARNQTMSACFKCPVGPIVEANSGGPPTDGKAEAAAKSPGFNWGFQGFGRGLAKSKAKAKAKAPSISPREFAYRVKTGEVPGVPPILTAKETASMQECKQCHRQLRKRRLDTPVPLGTEGLCNECRRKITRRKKRPEETPAPESESPTTDTVIKPAAKKPKAKKKKKKHAPSANGVLTAPAPAMRPAAYVARGTDDDRTLKELKEAIELVDAIGWDEARALARRFQSHPLRSVS